MDSTENIQTIEHFYWRPIQIVKDHIELFCIENKHRHILEIGPGDIPFSLATKIIGSNEKIDNYIDLDIDVNRLPFEDK